MAHSLKHTTSILAALTVACSLFGCVTPKQQPATADLPPAGPDGVYKVDFPATKSGEARHLLMVVSEDVTLRCPAPTPHFEVDVARLQADDAAAVRALAECLNSPPLREHDILVTGRADERGSEEYNLELGFERAAEVAATLLRHGVDPARIKLASEGEAQAKGAEGEYAHGYDRRVDVVILGQDHAPVVSEVRPYIPASHAE